MRKNIIFTIFLISFLFQLSLQACNSDQYNGYPACSALEECYDCADDITGCSSCTYSYFFEETICSNCEDGYFLEEMVYYQDDVIFQYVFNDCMSCDVSCALTCTSYGPDGCIECASGYFRNTVNNECQVCDVKCATCTGAAATTCGSCADGAYLSAATTCTACTSPCATCSGSATSCLTCIAGKTIVGTACVTVITNCNVHSATGCTTCADTYYPTGDTTPCASSCDALCQTCTGAAATACGLCADGAYLSAATTCTACNTNCSACSTSATACTSCSNANSDADLRDPSNTCACIANTFLSGSQCTWCDDACNGCTASGPDHCTACLCNFYNSSGTCIACDYRCATCSSPISCTACPGEDAALRDTTNFCSGCLSGYYLDADTDLCTACNANCTACDYVTSCTECPADSNRDPAIACYCKAGYIQDGTNVKCVVAPVTAATTTTTKDAQAIKLMLLFMLSLMLFILF